MDPSLSAAIGSVATTSPHNTIQLLGTDERLRRRTDARHAGQQSIACRRALTAARVALFRAAAEQFVLRAWGYDERMRLRRTLGAVGLIVVAGVIAGAIVRERASRSDPVGPDEALAAFDSAGRQQAPKGGPAPGVYRYRVVGTETGGAGPFSIHRRLPSQATLVVTGDGHGWNAELSYSRQHIEGARYVIRDGAILVTSRRTKVTFAGFGQDDRRNADPPSVFLPAGAVVGTHWSEQSRTGDIDVRGENRVLRAERIAVAGVVVDTLVIESRSTITGTHPGTRTEVQWWAPSLGLAVRDTVTMDIGGVFGFSTDIEADLVDTRPVR